ncbi:hypothetical protein JOE31_001037 [Arthrobacter sp. PvP023]|uniref:hypothetical protein n=1 Tax=Micrococcaceae TaxID=1268 RepID=UPI001AE884C6|nr:hypothetical protein [Arthrobacter sp. PvP023]MBP1134805.1 hypothetical protein [Arthrobacter sp. PvP023]
MTSAVPETTGTWQQLIGSRVELRLDGRIVRTGEVEDATQDSSVMWLRFDGNHGRQLVSKTDGYEVLPVS